MELHSYVEQIRAQLGAAAALGDERARHTADVLAAAAEPAVRLAVLAAVTAAADEITAALLDAPGAPTVAVRLDGDELRVDVRTVETADDEGPVAEQPADADATARISLRLSDSLKAQIDVAARSGSMSVNAWLVRAATRALGTEPGARPASGATHVKGAHRITGWVNG
jgi:hypothetical protein